MVLVIHKQYGIHVEYCGITKLLQYEQIVPKDYSSKCLLSTLHTSYKFLFCREQIEETGIIKLVKFMIFYFTVFRKLDSIQEIRQYSGIRQYQKTYTTLYCSVPFTKYFTVQWVFPAVK